MESPKWEKVLYKNNGLPDNYTDSKFLEDLRKNLHFKAVTVGVATQSTTRLSTQISLVVLFWSCFILLEEDQEWGSLNSISGWKILFGSFTVATIAAYTASRRNYIDRFLVAKNLIRFLAIGYACTPVLKTLTDSISTDTIYAMSSILMVVHLAFHHYGSDAACVSPYLSLNAAICSAICLASRLPNTGQAFILFTFAMEVFAFFPEFYEALNYPLSIFWVCTFSALSCLYLYVSCTVALSFLSVIIFVNVICPVCFVWAQKYKDNIHGPWDEAMICTKL